MKSGKGIIYLTLFLVLLVLIALGFTVFKVFILNNDASVEKDLRIYSTKGWVYDAEYVANVKSETYKIGVEGYYKSFDINDYKAPYININSSYAESVNNEIKKIYDEAVDVFNKGVENAASYIDTFEYKYYLVDNMLAVVLTTGYGATSVVFPDYYVYVINTSNGEKVELQEMLNFAKISENDFEEKAKSKIIDLYDSFYENIDKNDSLYTENYEALKQETLETYGNDNNKKCFIDNNGNINLVVSTFFPVERGYAYKIISVNQEINK